MSYSIIDCFMTAFFCGLIFGAVYEALRIVRRIFSMKSVTFICDVVFFIIAGFFVFNLSLYLGNYVRIYTILGFGAGVFAYIQTIGRLVALIETILGKVWAATFGAAFLGISRFIKRYISAFAHKIGKCFGTINDFFGKFKKRSTSPLQSDNEKMYNTKRDIIIGERSEKKYVIQAKVRRSP